MECKRALAETNGDLEAAIDFLRKKGAASAAKKADREAKEGIIAQAILPGAKVGVLVEVNCETDFVAKNDQFKAFCDDIAKKIAAQPGADLEADRVAAVQKIGENIQIRRSERIEVTGNGARRRLHPHRRQSRRARRSRREQGRDRAERRLQATRPRHHAADRRGESGLRRSRPESRRRLVDRERAIYAEQVPPGKPANIIEKIIDGKMGKFYSGVCLLDQAFIKNPDQTIAQLVAEKSKALGERSPSAASSVTWSANLYLVSLRTFHYMQCESSFTI